MIQHVCDRCKSVIPQDEIIYVGCLEENRVPAKEIIEFCPACAEKFKRFLDGEDNLEEAIAWTI